MQVEILNIVVVKGERTAQSFVSIATILNRGVLEGAQKV